MIRLDLKHNLSQNSLETMFDIDLVSWTPGGRQMSDRMMLNFVLENTIDLLKAPVFHSLPLSDLTYGSLDFRISQE